MRPPDFPQLSLPPKDWDPDWMADTLRRIEHYFSEYARMISGGLGFGDGTDFDNMMGKWLTYSTNAVKDTEDTLAHNLGAVPIGFIVFVPPGSGFVYKGTTTWTTANLYLRCSQAAQTALIFVIIPSQGLPA